VPGHSISYAYDPLGRRKTKTVDSVATSYVDSGDREIAEYDGSGNLLRRYVFGPGVDEPIVTIAVSGGTSTKSYNHQDRLTRPFDIGLACTKDSAKSS